MTTKPSTNLADTSCWTCRRRRLKCDRALPACQKCISLQQHCLGYSKNRPLRWTHSVASRGKLMGKKVPSQEQGFPIVRLLNDPSLQDLPSSTRGYLVYCKWPSLSISNLAERTIVERECSQECVLYDIESTNPFKEFMRLMPSCPGFRHAVVSVAALHQAYRLASSRLEHERTIQSDTIAKSPMWPTPKQLQEQPAYLDALYHKQQTLGFLKTEAYERSFSNLDGVIASILLSIWFELLHSGRNSWRHHLHGLREIMQRRDFSTSILAPRGLAATLSRLNEYFDTSYAMYVLYLTFLLPFAKPRFQL